MPTDPLTISLAVAGYLVTLFLIRWVVLLKKRNPASTVAWILAIALVPYVGAILFLIFGINRVERRADSKQEAKRRLADHLPDFDEFETQATGTFSELQTRMLRMADEVSTTHATIGNQIEVVANTKTTLDRITHAIESAQETIHLEYYIWRSDKTGRQLRDLLINKARQGVQIRFLYDALGTLFLFDHKFLKPMTDAGIEVAPSLPGASLRERWSINLRNHRKIIVVDGEVGFTGGMNIGDEYLGRVKSLGYWRDTHLRLRGPTVLQLQQVFAEDWFYATGIELSKPSHFPNPEVAEGVIAQVIGDGPDGPIRRFQTLMFAAINEARDRVRLETSYFVPTDALVSALETAALRGVDVQLIVPGRSAHPWTIWAGRSFYDSLLHAGVQIREYQRGILHAKVLTVDGEWSLVGSPNFDARSLWLNFEVAVAMYSKQIAATLEEQFDHDLQYSKRILPEDRGDVPGRMLFVENICRLFSPIL